MSISSTTLGPPAAGRVTSAPTVEGTLHPSPETETDTPAGALATTVVPAPATAAGSEPAGASERVLPLRHPTRWVASAVVVIVATQIAHGLVTNKVFQWGAFWRFFHDPVILGGLVITLKVTAYSAVLGFVGGVALALGRLSKIPLLQAVSWVYIWLFRSIPLLVLLLFLFNFSALYPQLSVGLPFGAALFHVQTISLLKSMALAVLGLSLNEAAYAAEVVRSGVLAVDQGQLEAADALGIPRGRRFRRIVLPQALRAIVPSYVNQLIGLVKASSLVYYVSLIDLFGQVETQGARVPQYIIPLLLVASAWYVVVTSVLSVVQYYVERHYARGALRTLPPTPLQRARSWFGGLRGRLATVASAA